VNPVRFITIHNTGNANSGANARTHANYIKGDTAANLPVSWHYTVDELETYQHLPDTEDAFHAGDGAGIGNRQSIGIEICMNSDGDLLKATDNAVELAAMLCKKYNIPIENVVQHFNWSGKNCPQMLRMNKPYSWNTFLNKIKAIVSNGDKVQIPAPNPETPEMLDKAINNAEFMLNNIKRNRANETLDSMEAHFIWLAGRRFNIDK